MSSKTASRSFSAVSRARDALKLKATDSVLLLLMALQHYLTPYKQIPARIAAAAREVTKAGRAAAQAEAKAATEEAKEAMMEAVRQVTARSAAKTAGQRAQWVGISGGLIGITLLVVGWAAFNRGHRAGRAIGTDRHDMLTALDVGIVDRIAGTKTKPVARPLGNQPKCLKVG